MRFTQMSFASACLVFAACSREPLPFSKPEAREPVPKLEMADGGNQDRFPPEPVPSQLPPNCRANLNSPMLNIRATEAGVVCWHAMEGVGNNGEGVFHCHQSEEEIETHTNPFGWTMSSLLGEDAVWAIRSYGGEMIVPNACTGWATCLINGAETQTRWKSRGCAHLRAGGAGCQNDGFCLDDDVDLKLIIPDTWPE